MIDITSPGIGFSWRIRARSTDLDACDFLDSGFPSLDPKSS
jgi:hypothetical protein